jgi:F0F1-type ATP synthase membrane subunit c/vacuolar-type H+-ATPase subunit K
VNRPAGEDPGWRPALGGSLWGLVPSVGIARTQAKVRRGELDGLVALRSLFIAFATALVLVGVVVVVLWTTADLEARFAGGPVAVAVGLAGLVLLVASTMVGRLDGSSEEALAESYRRRFFLRMSLSESAALLGFVGFILTENPAIYPLGTAFSAIGFALLAPTAANLARDQEALRRYGSRHSIVQALRASSPAGR